MYLTDLSAAISVFEIGWGLDSLVRVEYWRGLTSSGRNFEDSQQTRNDGGGSWMGRG
jgi:hypothetical protein